MTQTDFRPNTKQPARVVPHDVFAGVETAKQQARRARDVGKEAKRRARGDAEIPPANATEAGWLRWHVTFSCRYPDPYMIYKMSDGQTHIRREVRTLYRDRAAVAFGQPLGEQPWLTEREIEGMGCSVKDTMAESAVGDLKDKRPRFLPGPPRPYLDGSVEHRQGLIVRAPNATEAGRRAAAVFGIRRADPENYAITCLGDPDLQTYEPVEPWSKTNKPPLRIIDREYPEEAEREEAEILAALQ